MKFCGRTGRPAGLAALLTIYGAVAAQAATYGHPVQGQIGFQRGVTDVARYIHWFHNDILMPIITLISLFVLALLAYVVWRFNEKANPTPSKTTHNTLIEVAWTIIPVIILVIIAIPSFRLLTMQLTLPKADVYIKVTGSQWHWHYDYPKDQGGFSFDSFIKAGRGSEAGERRHPAAVGRQRGGGSGQQDRSAADQSAADVDPFLRHSVLRHSHRRGARPR